MLGVELEAVGGIEASGCAVARQRDIVNGTKVTLLGMSRNAGAFRQRNLLTAAIMIELHSAVLDVTGLKLMI